MKVKIAETIYFAVAQLDQVLAKKNIIGLTVNSHKFSTFENNFSCFSLIFMN